MNADESIKVGPVELAPGVSRLNFWSFIYASFICMLVLAGLNIMQPYLLNEILQLPRDEQGSVSGNLGVWQQVISLILINPFGWMADRFGRRPLLVFGIVVCGTALALHPYASNIAQLTACRMVFAVGTACIGSVIAIIANDYPAESSRGTLIGISSSMNGVGVLFITFVIAQIPAVLTAGGTDSATAGQVMFLVTAVLCVVSALWFRLGLQPGVPHVGEDKPPWKVLVLSGFRAARNPRILLSYGAAFIGRADVAITGMFLTLWALAAAPEAGLSSAEALAKGGMLLGIISVIGIVWVGVFGLILDRLNRVTGLAIAMAIAGAGYGSMWFVTSPLDYAMLPWFTLLSLGQTSVMAASVTLVGQEAAPGERGTIVAMNAFFGAIGIFLAYGIGGQLFDAIGPSAPFVMAGVVQLILVVVAVVVRIASPGDPQESSA